MLTKQIGKIDETGYLKGFKRQGFTLAKCVLELVANSLDSLDGSQHKCIHFSVSNQIKMIDNGSGMYEDGVEHMFALHRENHNSDKSRGVSGYGAKVSLSILSGEKETIIFTHKKDGPYLKVCVPWQKIHEKGQYTGMIDVVEMNEKERAAFREERLMNNMIRSDEEPVGTTIVFPYNDPLYEVIRNNFLTYEDQEDVHMKPLDRISIVFGREEDVHISCTLPEGSRTLELYNYFGGRDIDYWSDTMRETIELWTHKDDCRFLWRKADDTSIEIHKNGAGYSKKPEPSRKNTKNYTHIGDYEVLVGLRKQDNIDPANISGGKVVGEYDYKFLGENEEEYLGYPKLVRNGQGIGLIPSEIKLANARANAEQNFEIMLVQCDVCFSPTSNQDNRQDQITGIQQNKNQFDGSSLPKNFTRLIHYIKMQKSKELLKFFQEQNKKEEEEEKNQSQSEDEFIKNNQFDLSKDSEKTEETVKAEETEETVKAEETEETVKAEETEETVKPEEAKPDEVKPEEAKPDEVKPEEAKPDPKVYIPVDVKGHRKGCVLGYEFTELLRKILTEISYDGIYSDTESIEMFNKLRNFKIGH